MSRHPSVHNQRARDHVAVVPDYGPVPVEGEPIRRVARRKRGHVDRIRVKLVLEEVREVAVPHFPKLGAQRQRGLLPVADQ